MTPIERERGMIRPRPELEGLSPYRLRRDAAVKLNQNESPLDWPEDLKAAVLARVAARPWNRYPATDADALRRALAKDLGVSPEMVAVTNGSNEAILGVVETFATARSVVLTTPGYSMSGPLAIIGGASIHPVELRSDFGLDVPAMVRAIEATDAAMVFIASPNNPTGNAFARAEIEAILRSARGIVIVDEAYAHFAEDTFVPDLQRYAHLVIVRTFSKAFALAGARIGALIADADIVEALRTALPPYNVGIFAQEVALAALERPDLVAERVGMLTQERNALFAAMAALDGVTPYPSQTNFILFHTPLRAARLFDRLLERSVLVRDVSTQPMLENCLRVTIGSPEENRRFLEALTAALGEGP